MAATALDSVLQEKERLQRQIDLYTQASADEVSCYLRLCSSDCGIVVVYK